MTDTDPKSKPKAEPKAAKEPRQEEAGAVSQVGAFVRDHPLLVVAGGIALGAVAAAMLPRGTGRKLVRRAASLAEIAGTASAILGTQLRDKAEAAGAGLREQGGVVSDRLGKLGEDASARLGQFSEAAGERLERLIDPVENAANKVAKKAAELRSRVRH